MTLQRIDPLTDSRWPALVENHPRASIFHTRGWLEALRRTYGYQPIVVADGSVRNAIVFCDIRSWLTGRRLVSLPFSDHCDPLVDDHERVAFGRALHTTLKRGPWRSVELRPRSANGETASGFERSDEFCLHTLDVSGDESRLFARFHRTATQQMIRRAEREGLECRLGRDATALDTFYRLLLLTRKRHAVPPQPFAWFENLASSLASALTVRLAFHRGHAIAGIITVQHGATLVYKYAASDAAFHNLGSMPFLIWHAIRDARAAGCTVLDMGRTSRSQAGLLVFKDRWGAARVPLTYWRNPPPRPVAADTSRWVRRYTAEVLNHAPDGVRAAVGRLLYKHAG